MTEQTDKTVGRLPFSANEAIYLIEGLRNGLNMPFMTLEYQVLTYAISLIKKEARLIYGGKTGKEQTDNKAELKVLTVDEILEVSRGKGLCPIVDTVGIKICQAVAQAQLAKDKALEGK